MTPASPSKVRRLNRARSSAGGAASSSLGAAESHQSRGRVVGVDQPSARVLYGDAEIGALQDDAKQLARPGDLFGAQTSRLGLPPAEGGGEDDERERERAPDEEDHRPAPSIESVALASLLEVALLLVHVANEHSNLLRGATAFPHGSGELGSLAPLLARRAQFVEEDEAFAQEGAELIEPLSLARVVSGEGSETIEPRLPGRVRALKRLQERGLARHGITAHSTFGVDQGRLQVGEDHAHLVGVRDPLVGAPKGDE